MWTHTGNLRKRPKPATDRIATIEELDEAAAPPEGSAGNTGTSAVQEDGDSLDSSDGFSSQDEGESSPTGAGYARRITGQRKASSEKPLGVTLNGIRVFPIPELHDARYRLLHKCYSLPSLATWIGLLISLVAAVHFQSPQLLLLLASLWRIGCNVGLGMLLKHQSEHGSLTEWMQSLRDRSDSCLKRTVGTMLSQHMCSGVDVLADRTIPPSFPAWILVRCIVNLLEYNDVFAFTLTAILYGQAERHEAAYGTVVLLLGDLVGLVLISFSLYSKLDARRAGGGYAWYWGDFFFLRMGDVELSSGVFDIFPHPMYTVGYAWTYGCAIWARSFTVLSLAFAFHLSQLAFLTLVEVPHVDKLYSPAREHRPAPEGWLQRMWQLSGIPQFDITSDSEVALPISLVFFASGIMLGSYRGGPLDDDTFFVLMALFWQVLASVVKGCILVCQERAKMWTLYFKSKGKDSIAAYRSWQALFRLLQYLSHTAFHLCAIRLFWTPTSWLDCFSGSYVSRMLCGVLLCGISLWSFTSCYEELGDYGWYYGDFFLPLQKANKRSAARPTASRQAADRSMDSASTDEEDHLHSNDIDEIAEIGGVESTEMRPSYNSIYKYINNPEVYLGHLWMYGYALLCSSRDLCGVALLSHAMKIAFLLAVEEPYMRQVYKQHVREHTPLTAAIARRGQKIRNNEKAMFLINWVKHPIETGALAPSSKQLARAMCETMYLGDNSVVVELGPGTGPFTKEILRIQAEHSNTTYLAFELSDEFIERLRTKFPANKDDFIKESAEHIARELKKRNIEYADAVISGLPWAIFPRALQKGILDSVHTALRPGGRFCTFAYLQGIVLPAGRHFKDLLQGTFGNVKRSDIVWKNLPPAFVYRCQKTDMTMDGADAVHPYCKGEHSSVDCDNPACRSRVYCVPDCAGCPDTE